MRRVLVLFAVLATTGVGFAAAGFNPFAVVRASSARRVEEKAVYRIPYRLTDTNHVLVRARINGKGPFHFIIDTGAPDFFLATTAAKEAGISVEPGKRSRAKTLEIEGGAVMEGIDARVEEPSQLQGMNAMGLAGARIDGVFGYTVLSRFRMEIDFTEPTMRWTLLDYVPTVPPTMKQLVGSGPAPSTKDVAQMEQMTKWASAMFARAGKTAVGRGFIGIELASDAKGARISAVLPGSPAGAAGLKPGDRVRMIASAGKEATEVETPAALLDALAETPAGSAVKLTIDRGGAKKTVALTAGKGAL
jgi:serine protease Do